MLFWNMGLMYWLTSKQLTAWMQTVALREDQDPDLLNKQFSLNMKYYKRVNTCVKILLIVLAIFFSISNILQTKFDRNNTHPEAYIFFFRMTIALLACITLFGLVIMCMLLISFRTLRQSG